MRTLLTGFEPFDGSDVNPSFEAVRLVPGVAVAELPCVFATSLAALRAAIDEHRPDLVLCVGQAGGRAGITVEKVAVNLIEARIPDNAGAQPLDEPVVPGGPAAYFAHLPVKAMVGAVRAAGLPAAVSYSAGTFVCNQVAYGLAHLIETELPHLRGGFVHVPYSPAQVVAGDQPSMAIPEIARALDLLVRTATTVQVDVQAVAGEIA
ncbi:pyroglutamyl-peptidase I [Nonomuraea sp. NPDC050310]|uniref:pyroglutamyl-peptidase I n=1 Tax=unclassified Nonomuraea TaxID=2593643 RepID=UPI0033CCA89B